MYFSFWPFLLVWFAAATPESYVRRSSWLLSAIPESLVDLVAAYIARYIAICYRCDTHRNAAMLLQKEISSSAPSGHLHPQDDRQPENAKGRGGAKRGRGGTKPHEETAAPPTENSFRPPDKKSS